METICRGENDGMDMIGSGWRDSAPAGIAGSVKPSRTQHGVGFSSESSAERWDSGGVRLKEGAVIGPEGLAVSDRFPFEERSFD